MTVFIDRRTFLGRTGAFAGMMAMGGPLALLAEPAMAAAANSIPLRLNNVHTGEAYDVQLFIEGGWNSNALIVCDHLMRDWRQSKSVTCDRKLYASLYVIQRYFAATQRINLNSGYRTRETNELLQRQGYGAVDNSYHIKAKAVDFHIPGADLKQVARAVRQLGIGGTGLYDTFVHMDSRGHPAQWGLSF